MPTGAAALCSSAIMPPIVSPNNAAVLASTGSNWPIISARIRVLRTWRVASQPISMTTRSSPVVIITMTRWSAPTFAPFRFRLPRGFSTLAFFA